MTDDTDPDDRTETTDGERTTDTECDTDKSAYEGTTGQGSGALDRGADPSMDPADLERLFDVLDAGVGSDAALPTRAQDQLLSVLEAVVLSPTRVEGDELDRLFSVLESAIVEPTSPETAEEVLSVLEVTVVNPARLEGTETDGVLSVLESAVVDPTDPGSTARDVFSLFDAAGIDAAGGSESTGTADPVDGVSSLFDAVGLGVGDSRAGQPESTPGTEPTAPDDTTRDESEDGASRRNLDRPFRLARVVAAATQRSTEYSLRSGIRVGTGVVAAVRESESLAELVDEARGIAFEELDRLGVDVGESATDDDWTATDRLVGTETLRERGARLLELSADVDHEEPVHPAFPRILNELAADEARILRLLATEGPQPSVDVRDVGYLPVGSELVAAGLSMIGTEAGCRHEHRTPAYLNNLKRLGLVWFSDEPVRNVKRYQVLEAQPHVADEVDACRRAKTIRRSIHLTPFGVDFCRVCLPVDVAAEDVAGAYEAPEDLTK